MIKIGLTGGIGSGKSTIAKCFSTLGIPVYNADLEAKKIINRNTNVQEQLIKAFGEKIYKDGKLNTKKFSPIIFKDKDSLKKSNEIIHPVVKLHYEAWLQSHRGKTYIIKETAIMFESGSYKEMDKIITVFSPEKLRVMRLLERPGLTTKLLHKIIAVQISEEDKIKKADFVIFNDELQAIIPQILEIHKKISQL